MDAVFRRCARTFNVVLFFVAIACAGSAEAAFTITTIDYPGALTTDLWGINNRGEIVGTAFMDATSPAINFLYNFRKKTFTVLPNAPGAAFTDAIAINDAGVVTGSAGDGVSDRGFLLSDGAFTMFSRPGWSSTDPRSIGESGLVTGQASDGAGNSVGFIYDPGQGSFTDFLPSSFTIPQGINSRGQVAGSVVLVAGAAYAGSPAGIYGFVRNKSGTVRLFQIAGGVKAHARGINDSGRIAGFFADPATGLQHGFVTSLSPQPGYQTVSVPAGDLLDAPGAILTSPEGIDEAGRVSGQFTDANGNDHGFLAIPANKED